MVHCLLFNLCYVMFLFFVCRASWFFNLIPSVLPGFVTIMLRKRVLASSLLTFDSCSSQLSAKFQLLIKAKIPTNEKNLSDDLFIMLINDKLPTIVDILTFMSRINFVFS